MGAGAEETTTSDEDTVTATDCTNEFNEYTDGGLDGCTLNKVSVTVSGECSIDATCQYLDVYKESKDVHSSITIALDKIVLLRHCHDGTQLQVAASIDTPTAVVCANN